MVKEAVRQMIGTGPMCRYAVDLLPMLKVMTKDCKDDLKLDEPVSILTFFIFKACYNFKKELPEIFPLLSIF